MDEITAVDLLTSTQQSVDEKDVIRTFSHLGKRSWFLFSCAYVLLLDALFTTVVVLFYYSTVVYCVERIVRSRTYCCMVLPVLYGPTSRAVRAAVVIILCWCSLTVACGD